MASAFKSKRGDNTWTTITSDLQGLEESTFSLMKKAENFNRELKEDSPKMYKELIGKQDFHSFSF